MTIRGAVTGLVAAAAMTVLVAGGSPAQAEVDRPGSSPAQVTADPDQELAERYAPVLRVRTQDEICGDGESYLPVDIDAIMDNDGVALRGPWSSNDLVSIAPGAADLADGLTGYHLDFPGDPLEPGCSYERWSRDVTADTDPVVYARVVTDPIRRDQIALQYWFFYAFNDWNNNHEGDWEMIQLNFDATDATEALATTPSVIGYSQHAGGERAEWGSEELELVDDTHPVVYPGEGSHANFFAPDLHLGRSAETGVGCDDTREPHTEIRPRAAVVPTERDAYQAAYPWLAFEGRWGERQEAFFNGPTGPNMKRQWTLPIVWAEQTWRDDSVSVPLPTALGPNITNTFCGVVESGSNLLRTIVRDPLPAIVALTGVVAIVIAAASRTTWTGGQPLPVAQRRSWGQVLTAAWHMYARHWRLFIGIGLVYVPVMLIATGAQWLVVQAADLASLIAPGDDDHNALTVFLVLLLGNTISLLAYVCVLAAVSQTLDALGNGRTPSLVDAYRAVSQRLRPLVGVTGRIVLIVALLLIPFATAPLALIYIVYRAFAVPVVMVEHESVSGALRRSRELVRGRWWRTALLLALVVGIGVVTGPLVGLSLLIMSGTAFWLVNLIAGVVYVATMPFVALVIVYLYLDFAMRVDSEQPAQANAPIAS